ncbi:phosphatidylserine decarboxylase family protein [candidate division GN15 bacterium]|nr:phosphatidylserine decarboxylase family protein [candidate division GN15 bacterium]
MIAREGLHLILIALATTGILIVLAARFDSRSLFVISLVFGLLTLFTTFFFRDPPRACPDDPGILVSPADGRIVAIDSLPDHPWVGGPAIKVSIFLSVFDVHINRVPATGTVDAVDYNAGEFIAAYHDKASDVNEQTEIRMTSSDGHRIVCKQIAGVIARRIVCHLTAGDEVGAGDRFGLIRFGSRTDLIVPADSRIDVTMGQTVKGCQTVMGYLPGHFTQADSGPSEEHRDAGL